MITITSLYQQNKKILLLFVAITMVVLIILLSPFTIIDGKLYSVNSEELSLTDCTLSRHDIKKLSKFKKVRVLKLDHCNADSVHFILSMHELSDLTILGDSSENCSMIRDLTAISSCSKLKKIKIYHMGLTDLSLFKNLSELEELDIPHNFIEDISDLSSLKNLKEICIWGDNISDLTEFSALQNLKLAVIVSKNIHDITPLTMIKSIERISIGKAQEHIEIPDLSNCSKLKDIRLSSKINTDYSILLSAPALKYIYIPSGILSYDLRSEFTKRGIEINEVEQ